jgi:hypothetical protein
VKAALFDLPATQSAQSVITPFVEGLTLPTSQNVHWELEGQLGWVGGVSGASVKKEDCLRQRRRRRQLLFAQRSKRNEWLLALLLPPPLQLFACLALASLARSARAGKSRTCPSPVPEYSPTSQFSHAESSADAVLALAFPASHSVHSETP